MLSSADPSSGRIREPSALKADIKYPQRGMFLNYMGEVTMPHRKLQLQHAMSKNRTSSSGAM